MIIRFLRAKHWQLFLLTFGIPAIFQFILMGTLISGSRGGNEPNPEFISNYFMLFPLIMLLFMGVLFAWLWSVAIGLNRKIPERLQLKVSRFKVFIIIPMIYLILLPILIGIIMNPETIAVSTPNLIIIILLLMMHLFSMFCIFYCLYFVAKTIKTAELQREVRFGDFAGEFFLIWFYPIGIWFVQPKINKMIEEGGVSLPGI